MKITNRQVLGSIQALRALQNRKLPAKMTYAVTKNTKTIQDAVQSFMDAKQKLMADYAIPERDEDGEPKKDREGNAVLKEDEDGNVIWKSVEDEEKAEEAINEVIEEEVEVDVHQFHFDNLPDEIEPSVLGAIDYMLMED